MANNSAIEWTEATWNPIVGCSILTPGCINCYAMPEAARQIRCAAGLGRETHYAGTVETVKGKPVWTGKLALAPDSILLQPLKRRKPTIYFVNSMGDLFHEDCPDSWIDRVFAVMALCPQHTFQVLTKRAKRMRDYFTGNSTIYLQRRWARAIPYGTAPITQQEIEARLLPGIGDASRRLFRASEPIFPVPNVWLGVSTERQQEADERIPLLLQTPAAVRFISAEPLLGPIYLDMIRARGWALTQHMNVLTGTHNPSLTDVAPKATLDWVIVGGESGPNARPMHPDWARRLREQCKAAGVPFFFKQWGTFVPTLDRDAADCTVSDAAWCRVGKKAAGRLLDGELHNAMPEIAR